MEDFDTAPSRIREGAEDLFRASVSAYHGGTSSLSSQQLKKSTVGSSMSASGLLSGSSSWDMVLSSNLVGGVESLNAGRGWDWRKGLDGVGGARVDGKGGSWSRDLLA